MSVLVFDCVCILVFDVFFFMFVIIIGSFLIMQLFITVVFENFISQRCQFGAKTITPAQLDLIEFEDRLIFDTGESSATATRPRWL